MADALTALRDLIEAQEAEWKERRDLYTGNRQWRLNEAATRTSKAMQAAKRVLAAGVEGKTK